MKHETKDGALEVEVVNRSDDKLELRYAFQTRSDRNAYVFSRITDRVAPGPVFEAPRDRVYVEVHGKRVVVSKKVFPVPAEVDVEKPVVPPAIRVMPGSEVGETITLDLPLLLHSPYRRGGGGKPDMLRSLEFELGVFFAPPESDTLAKPVETSQGPAFLFSPFPIGSQVYFRVGAVSLAVPVREERD